MSPNKIKAMLVERGVKQCDIAKELGIAPSSVGGAIRGYRQHRSRRVHEAVAAKVGKPIEKLWPHLYA
jgi:predicted transcriptional regulator